ncbi:MAG: aminoacetone oxidase family FAD-binding enzyme [Candidatus Ornithospirochaeta sp.]
MERTKTAIVGGGASGLFLASLLPSSLLIEKNSRVGLKLLLTGGGKCNITHGGEKREIVGHYYEKKNFVSPSIFQFGPEKIVSYFSSIGLPTFEREDGKIFPISERSLDVVECLENRCRSIITGCTLVGVEKKDSFYILHTSGGDIETENLVFATGGASFPKTGSDGSVYSILSSLGHTIVPPVPALSQIKVKEDVSGMEGITVENASIKIGKHRDEGSLLFTRDGISGPMALNLSRFVPETPEMEISLSSFPSDKIRNLNPKAKAMKAVHEETGLPTRVLETLLSWKDKNIADLSRKDIAEYRDRIEKWRTTASTKGHLKSAMATRGGVDTREVDSRTFLSKKNERMWIIGEALDVDGECGGYNLTFAFSSAYASYLSISGKE